MVEDGVGDNLKQIDGVSFDLAKLYLSSSLDAASLDSLGRCIKNVTDESEAAIDEILKQFITRTSLKSKVHLFDCLAKALKDNNHLGGILLNKLLTLSRQLESLTPTKASAKNILFVSKLLSRIQVFQLEDQFLSSFVEAQANLSIFFAQTKLRRLRIKNFGCVHNCLSGISDENIEKYHKILNDLSSSNKLCYAIHWNDVLCFDIEKQNTKLIEQYKPNFIDLFGKAVVQSKLKIVDLVDAEAFEHLISQISLEEFKNKLFSLLQKSILRSAEVSLSLLGLLFSFARFDLSTFSEDVAKLLGNHSISKDETLQNETLSIVGVFITKCSTIESVKHMLANFVNIYNGSLGKLSNVNQKTIVLKIIATLAHNKVEAQQTLQPVLNEALEQLIKMAKLETVESNILMVLFAIKQWLLHAQGLKLPESFWKYFKEQRKSKFNTSPIQSILYECLFVYFASDANLSDANVAHLDGDSINSIVASSKNATLSISKSQALSESLYASTLLLQIVRFIQPQPKSFLDSFKSFRSIYFLTEKFIAETSLESAMMLAEFMKIVHNTQFNLGDTENATVFSQSLLFLMSHPSYKTVRDEAIQLYKEKACKDKLFAASTVNVFYELFHSRGNDENKGNSLALFKCCCILLQSIEGEFSEDEASLYLDVLKVSHIPFVYEIKPELYPNFIGQHFEDGNNLVSYFNNNFQVFIDLVMNSAIAEPIKLNIVRSFAFLIPHTFIETIVRMVANNLEQQSTELKAITPADLFIAQTPAGTLYNTGAVLNVADSTVDKNMKRESKLYSYKEQMAEIELRKELEKNKKKSGEVAKTLDVNKLSKKQLEVYNQELAKEETIRTRVNNLKQKFTFNLSLLSSMVESNPVVAVIHYKDIVYMLFTLLPSIFCSEQLSKFVLTIRKPMMLAQTMNANWDYIRFMDTIAFTLIRIYQNNPAKDDDLDSIITRLVEYLCKRTCHDTSGHNYDEKLIRLANENRLTTSAFSYVFPLFRYILLTRDSKNMHNFDEIVDKIMAIIVQHSLLRNKENDLFENESLKNPQHLPVRQIIETLIKFMAKNAEHEKSAAAAVISVAQSVTGKPCCGHASWHDVSVLLNYFTNVNELIRVTCHEAVHLFSSHVLPKIHNERFVEKLTHRVFVATFDPHPECQNLARLTFEACRLATSGALLHSMLYDDVENANSLLVISLPEAYKHLLHKYPEELESIYDQLVKFYEKKARASIPVVDAFGRLLSKDHVDVYQPRLTIAYIFKNIVQFFTQKEVQHFINFLISGALCDNDEHVRTAMLEAGCQLIDNHYENNINFFLDAFEAYLDSAPDDHKNDLVRKNVIVFMGTLAKHIDSDNPKLKPILGKLVEALSTPSQMVQDAVANCLQYLIPKFKEDAPALLQKLLQLLFESEIYGERKGAAYGIAGIVKGLGILSLNKLGIMDALTQAIRSKDAPNNREGALFAFEMLSFMLARLFEPYIVHILPDLLDCFGDSSVRVRQAADDTAKVIMSKLSAPGVTLIYPTILTALEDDSWRKKTSSIELLGSMAFCAPKQLSQCLPKIVPKLMTVIIDSHPKVQKSAAYALKQIGSVIKNPEIQEIVPILLEALQDRANKTNQCLSVMLNMKFVHVVDPPSLALIMPVIERAFQSRSTETRKMASQIIGNMYALTKSKDLSPYLPSIIPGLKNSLLDPVPEVRTVTSRALGAMVKSLGSEVLSDLMPWLKAMLISEVSSVDRSGAAQGLAEVIGGLGIETLEAHMPEIIAITERNDVPPYVKDGYILLFIYLPLVFTQQFVVYIPQVINPILKALADENEFVRETALRAGQRIVNMYADTAIQLLLPELEKGLFDENWRIRYCSVQLLGDLLFKIVGVSGKMTTESGHEDDNFGTDQSHMAIYDALGEERHNYVLSGLYMCRSDVALQVRQASLHVWKVIVSNTPRTLKEILPVLFKLLLTGLASNSSDHQQCAARTLGDLVRKLGERILPEIIPIIEQGLEFDRPDHRQGVCIGLSEIIASTSREMVQVFADNLIPTIKRALSDDLPEVRLVAAKAFDQLYTAIGNKALDDILPGLVNQLDDPVNGERTLDSLKNIIAFRSNMVLPYLIPKLIVPPVNTRALSLVSSVAGDSLSKHLSKILPPLLDALAASKNEDSYEIQLKYCRDVVLSITDELGVTQLVMTLLDKVSTESNEQRQAAVALLVSYCLQVKPQLIASFRPQLLRGLILTFSLDDPAIVGQCVEALNAIIKSLSYEEHISLIPEVRNAIKHTLMDHKSNVVMVNGKAVGSRQPDVLPGFNINKGVQPLLSFFREAILHASGDARQSGFLGFKEVIDYASSEALQPSVMFATGTLLRVTGERLPAELKIITIDVISVLLVKVGAELKPFYPQIHSIFFRALADPVRTVRLQGAKSLSRFALVCGKIEKFIDDMVTIIRSYPIDARHMIETGYYALRLTLNSLGEKIPEQMFEPLVKFCLEERDNTVNAIRIVAAACFGELISAMPAPMMLQTFDNYLYENDKSHAIIMHYSSIAMQLVLKNSFKKLYEVALKDMHHIRANIIRCLQSGEAFLAMSGIRSVAYYIDGISRLHPTFSIAPDFLAAYAKTMNSVDNDVKQTFAKSVIYWSSKNEQYHHILLEYLVPQLVNGTKERNSAVRVDSEQALVSLLKLKDPESQMFELALKHLNEGASQAMQDTVAKIRKSLNKFNNYKEEEEFDSTLLIG